jgi:hypothetical protein
MKRVVAAAGAWAVGVAGLQAQNLSGLSSQEASKWWNISGYLRGIYDDNSFNAPKGNEEESFGIEFSPGVSVNLPLDRTLFNASYRFTMNYYEARPEGKIDQDHTFDAHVNHKFSQRHSVDLRNTFVYSDAPEVLDQNSAQQTFNRRQDSSGLRNSAVVDFTARMTPTAGMTIGYRNNLRDYKETGTNSLSALLDQVEHLVKIDGNWFPAKDTILFVGYQIGLVDYTSGDLLGTIVSTNQIIVGGNPVLVTEIDQVEPTDRNSLSHYLYVGGRRDFSRQLQGAASIGIQYADFYNADETSLSPYVDLTATYTYLPGSWARLGLTVQRNSTDTGLGSDGSLTLDQESASVYASVSHRVTSRITAAVLARYQHSVYNGGDYDGQADNYFTLDLNGSYKIRENLFAEAGYVYYHLSSDRPDVPFSRNRVYIGIRAAF